MAGGVTALEPSGRLRRQRETRPVSVARKTELLPKIPAQSLALRNRFPARLQMIPYWKTRLTVPHVFHLFAICGFAEVFHLTRRRTQQQYFCGRGDTPHVPQLEQLFAATV